MPGKNPPPSPSSLPDPAPPSRDSVRSFPDKISRLSLRLFIAIASVLACACAILACGLAAVPWVWGREAGYGFDGVEASLCAMDGDASARALVAGDSRAKVQVDPAVIENATGLRTINIAEAISFGGDLPTLVNVLRRHPEALASKPALILSVSALGVNDMDYDSAPIAVLLNWSLRDHLRVAAGKPARYLAFLFGQYLPMLKRMALHKWRGESFVCDDGMRESVRLTARNGWRPYPVQAARKDIVQFGYWDAGTLLDGGRWRIFKASLDWLERSPASAILMYDAPLDPAWRAAHRNSAGYAGETLFSDMMAAEALRHPRIHYLDFFRHPDARLDSAGYYDYAHLDENGAEVFSRILADSLKVLLSTH